MVTNYEFDRTTRNGTEYIIAQPHSQGEPVRFEAKWTESGEMEGEWEQLIKPVIKDSLMGQVDVNASDGRLARNEFVRQLAAAVDDEGNAVVSSERQADALVSYLAENNILEASGGEVVFLQNPFEGGEDESAVSKEMWVNWAACIDACVEQIQSTIETVDSAKKKLEEHRENVEDNANQGQQYLEEVAQELRGLGEGPEVPDPEKLDAQEEQRYHTLKEEFVFHKQMRKVKVNTVLENIRNGAEVLSRNRRMLEQAEGTLSRKSQELRQAALQQEIFPEGAENIVNNVGDLATQLGNVQNVDEAVAQMSPQDLEDELTDVIGPAREINDATERITEGQERQEQSDTH